MHPKPALEFAIKSEVAPGHSTRTKLIKRAQAWAWNLITICRELRAPGKP